MPEPGDGGIRPLWAALGLMVLLVAVCGGCELAALLPLVGP